MISWYQLSTNFAVILQPPRDLVDKASFSLVLDTIDMVYLILNQAVWLLLKVMTLASKQKVEKFIKSLDETKETIMKFST